MKNSFVQTRKEREKQSYSFLSFRLSSMLMDEKPTILAFTSSMEKKDKITTVLGKTAADLRRTHRVVMVIADPTIPEDTVSDLKDNTVCSPVSKVPDIINHLKDSYDAILVILPPIRLWADTLAIAASADVIFLVEQYGYSRYTDMENTLDLLKQNNLKVSGIITYR